MLNKFFIFIFISFLLVVTVTAQQSISEQVPSFQFNKQFDLKRPCFDNGFFCSSSFNCNITLLSPDGSILLDNSVMTNTATYRNITVSQALNDQLGFVTVFQSCNNGSLAGPDTFVIAITGDGKPHEKFPQQFVIIIIALLLIIIGMYHDQLRMIKNVGSMILMVMGVITLYPGYSFINYSTLLGLTLGTSFIGMGFYFMINDAFSRNEQEGSYEQRPEVESLDEE